MEYRQRQSTNVSGDIRTKLPRVEKSGLFLEAFIFGLVSAYKNSATFEPARVECSMRALKIAACFGVFLLAVSSRNTLGQTGPLGGYVATPEDATHPPDYAGVRLHIPGVFVTPISGAPFSGSVQILSKEPLPDGTTRIRQTVNHIARNSAGVIHNETRLLVTPGFEGEPRLLSFHIYDPQTHLNTFLNPTTHIARQVFLRKPPTPPVNSTPETFVPGASAEKVVTQELGNQTVAGLLLQGTRKQRIVPAATSGTGHEVTITDDYWYSEELRVYLVIRHNDPRTGEQTVGIIDVQRGEPNPTMFQIPVDYKVVDETPLLPNSK